MNTEIKHRWVEALRSGEYEQGQDVLGRVQPDRSHFCCLGVLCELAAAEGVVARHVGADGDLLYDREENYLPAAVVAWAGLESEALVHGDVRIDPPADSDRIEMNSLAKLNDQGWSFAEIADVIEEQL